MLGMLYDTEDRNMRSQIDAEVGIQALSVVSRLSQLTSACPKPTGSTVFLKWSISYLHGICGKPQGAPVLLT